MQSRRNTIQRKMIADAVCQLNHPNAEQVYAKVVRQNPNVSKATVYRNLHLLVQEGMISTVQADTGSERFDYKTHKHYHLRCRICGEVFDADLPVFSNLEEQVKNNDGFKIEDHTIEFIGVCNKCKNEIGG